MHAPTLTEMPSADPIDNMEVEILPGTEIMVDLDGHHSVHAHNSASAVVLVPQPTANLDDPLVRRLTTRSCE